MNWLIVLYLGVAALCIAHATKESRNSAMFWILMVVAALNIAAVIVELR